MTRRSPAPFARLALAAVVAAALAGVLAPRAAHAEGPSAPESLAALQARLDTLAEQGEEASATALPAI